METKRYIVRNKDGWEIEQCDTIEEALDVIENHENEDEYSGIYELDFYEIYDSVKREVVWE